MRRVPAAAEEMPVRLGFFALFGFLAFMSAWWGLHFFDKIEYPPIRQVDAIITDCHDDTWGVASAIEKEELLPVRVCNGTWTFQGRNYYGELADNSVNGRLADTDTEGKRVTISVFVSDPGHVVDPDDHDLTVGRHSTTVFDLIPRPVYGGLFIAVAICLGFVSLAAFWPDSYTAELAETLSKRRGSRVS